MVCNRNYINKNLVVYRPGKNTKKIVFGKIARLSGMSGLLFISYFQLWKIALQQYEQNVQCFWQVILRQSVLDFSILNKRQHQSFGYLDKVLLLFNLEAELVLNSELLRSLAVKTPSKQMFGFQYVFAAKLEVHFASWKYGL